MEKSLGNGSNAAYVCLDSSWGKFTTPSHLCEPNHYNRGIRGCFGEQGRQQMDMDGEGYLRAPCLVLGSALESPEGKEGQTCHSKSIINRSFHLK